MRLSKDHYEVFKYAFDREDDRFKELIKRGEIYVTIIVIYIGTLTLKTSELQVLIAGSLASKTLLTVAAAAVILALLLTLLALGIYVHEEPWIAERAAGSAQQAASIEDFYEDRIADFAVAARRNAHTNNRRARLLALSSYCLAAAISCHLLAFLAYAYEK